MSIKIYTGFILPQTTLEQALDKIRGLRHEIRKDARLRINKLVARKAILAYDRWLAREIYGEEIIKEPRNPVSETWWDIHERCQKIERERGRDPEVDFGFEMALLPVRGDILGIPYTETDEWVDMWMAKDGVHAFGYWDNTDRPDDVTLDDWIERGHMWEEAMAADPAGGRPGYSGLSAHVHELMPPMPGLGDVVSAVPPVEKRAEVIAKESIRNKVVRDGIAGMEKPPMSTISNLIFKTQERFESDEGRAELDALIARIRTLIPETITEDTFRGT